MEMTLTAKVLLRPTAEQKVSLLEAGKAFVSACNYVSNDCFESHILYPVVLQKKTYATLRCDFGLPSQLACNVVRQVIGSYRTILENQKEWIKPSFKHTARPLSWNRDDSLNRDGFSIGTLHGRIKVPYEKAGMEKYLDGSWTFGLARVVYKHGKWFLHISVSKEFEALKNEDVVNVVGVDLGINFIATAYGSNGKTRFYKGRLAKQRRAQKKGKRKQLQKRKTASSRRRLKRMGSRESRWMQDVNHCIRKALVDSNPRGTAFVLEDLTGIRNATERVRKEDRYVMVSWAFYDLGKKLEYKAKLHGDTVIYVDPRSTSQTCPQCGFVAKNNRDKQNHVFECQCCHYKSNDDRVGSMNLHRKGIEYLSAVVEE